MIEYLGFDEMNRVTSRRQTALNGTAYTVTAGYAPAGLQWQQIPGGRKVSYDFDAAGG